MSIFDELMNKLRDSLLHAKFALLSTSLGAYYMSCPLCFRLGHGVSGAVTDRPTHQNNTMDDLDLKTVDDLGRSILAYGANVSSSF